MKRRIVLLAMAAVLMHGADSINLPLVSGPDVPPPPTGLSIAHARDGAGHEIGCNSRFFTRDGRPVFPVMGEVHYSRIPRAEWGRILDTLKDSGVGVVASYVFWIHHEEVEGEWDWQGNRDLRAFLDLCRQKGLQVWLRIGPWSHGECRNGGFPDWLMERRLALRTTDAGYLAEVRKFYGQIADQVRGHFFQDGGPVIGIQIENEFGWDREPGIGYMLALKRMATEAGFTVPFVSQFSPKFPEGQRDFLAAKGGYVDAPWLSGTTRNIREGMFRFARITSDPLVGADQFGVREEAVARGAPLHPVMMAEFGGGFQHTYRRRPRLFPGDVASAAYVKVGSGCNLLGYYMFHGGSNGLGKRTTLQEGDDYHVTWNIAGKSGAEPERNRTSDLSIISYDFQAPIREFGQANEHLAELRLLHLALQDFGSELAQTTSHIPREADPPRPDTPALRYAVRSRGDAGFVFFNNHTRYLPSPAVPGIRFEQRRPDGSALRWPDAPLTIPAESYGFLPYGLEMGDARLAWATVQPLCLLDGSPGTDERTWVFASIDGIEPRLAFDPATVKAQRRDGALTTVTTASGRTIKVLVLSRDQARQAHKIRWRDRDFLLLTDGQPESAVEGIRFSLYRGSELAWRIYPAVPLTAPDPALAVRGETDGIFAAGSLTLPASSVTVTAAGPMAGPAMDPVTAGKAQPGLLYGATWKPVGGSMTWRLTEQGVAPACVREQVVEIAYDGDTSALYRDGRLVADHLQNGEPLRFALSRVQGGPLDLQIIPFTPAREAYLEEPDLKTAGLTARIRTIRVNPVYDVTLKFPGH